MTSSDGHLILNILCLGKYLSKSFETLQAENTRHHVKIFEKNLAVIMMTSVSGPFNGYHEMKHNSAVTRQNEMEFWNQKAKQDFS